MAGQGLTPDLERRANALKRVPVGKLLERIWSLFRSRIHPVALSESRLQPDPTDWLKP